MVGPLISKFPLHCVAQLPVHEGRFLMQVIAPKVHTACRGVHSSPGAKTMQRKSDLHNPQHRKGFTADYCILISPL